MPDDNSTPAPSDEYLKSLGRIELMVERQGVHVSEIPSISREVSEIKARLAQSEQRLDKIEHAGHSCLKEQTFIHLSDESERCRSARREMIKTSEEINSMKSDLEDTQGDIQTIAGYGKTILGSLAAASLTIVLTVFGGSWSLATKLSSLEANQVAETHMRQIQQDTLSKRLDKIPTKETIKQNMMPAAKEIKNAEEQARCSQLGEKERAHLTKEVQAGRLPPTFLCW